MIKKNETIINTIKQVIADAIYKICETDPSFLSNPLTSYKYVVEKTRQITFGDFSSNIALVIKNAKIGNCKEIAQLICQNIQCNLFEKVEISNNGFINFFLKNNYKEKCLKEIVISKEKYGNFAKKNLFYNMEYVSGNPTGLLHIGHARNAAAGDSLIRIWQAYGIRVDKEYYINDGGNQINKLALSVLIRYLQLFNEKKELPQDAYHGDEVIDAAIELKKQFGPRFLKTKFDGNRILDKDDNETISVFAKNYMMSIIKQDLTNLGAQFEIWSPESNIYKYNLLDKTLQLLKKHIYVKDNATWLRTTELGDDKDRVLIKSNHEYTYFCPDIAYHNIKLSRGYDKIFAIWGADHKSYVDRMRIAIQLLGYKSEQFHVCIMQMVKLVKNGQEFKMSKRSGDSFTVQDLLKLLGKDASRWYLVSQSLDSHITIDIEKATKKSIESSFYYVQYAYVRGKQLLNKAKKMKMITSCSELKLDEEQELINQLLMFKPTIEHIANSFEVHKMCLYLQNLAKLFHSFYEKATIVDPNDKTLTGQRLFLVNCITIVIKNGFSLLGVDAVETM